MALVRWDPWSEFARMRREFDGLFADRNGEWLPAADVARDDEQITLTLDLPGIAPGDVRVELHDQRIVITGERKQESEEKRDGLISRERVFGSFVREFALPVGVNADDVHARFANGELTVTVPLPPQSEAKQIEVQTPEHAAV